jgi:hypothetical protein
MKKERKQREERRTLRQTLKEKVGLEKLPPERSLWKNHFEHSKGRNSKQKPFFGTQPSGSI